MAFDEFPYVITVRRIGTDVGSQRTRARRVFERLRDGNRYKLMLTEDLQRRLAEFEPDPSPIPAIPPMPPTAMTGITFPMWAGDVPVMLPDLLTRIGTAWVRDSLWTLRGVEAAGDTGSAQALETMSQQGLGLPGGALIALAERGVQIIDGELVGRRGDGAEPWIVLRGVDRAWSMASSTPARP
jgi:hypothetical protein